jgi:hypothetical protein
MPAPAFVVDARDEDLMLAYAAGDATAFDASMRATAAVSIAT